MSQQAGPHGEQPTIDYRIPARSWEPEMNFYPIPLKNRVTLYFHHLQTDSAQIQELVYLKTLREDGGMAGYAECDVNEQQRMIAEAERVSENDHHPWKWTHANIGRYIASGLTQPNDLELAIGLSAEEIKKVVNDEKVEFNLTCAGST